MKFYTFFCLFFESNKIIQFRSIESEAKKSPFKSFPINQKKILDKNNNQSNEQITSFRDADKNIARLLAEIEEVTERENENVLHQRLVGSAKKEAIKSTNGDKKGRNSNLNL
jgi:hypothetical protein